MPSWTYELVFRGGPEVRVSLEAPGADQAGTLVFDGPHPMVTLVSQWLSVQTGRFGHLIGSRTTPADLVDVMRRQPKQGDCQCRLLEGDEDEAARSAGVPDGTVS